MNNTDTHISSLQFALLFFATGLSIAGGIFIGKALKKPAIGVIMIFVLIAVAAWGINKLPRTPNNHAT